MRLPIVPPLSTKDGSANKNARLTNCLKESKKTGDKAVIRPGLVLDAVASGVGNGLVSFNGELVSVYGATLGIANYDYFLTIVPNSGTQGVSGSTDDEFVEVAYPSTSLWSCDIAFNGSMYVTIGYPDIIAYSSDGVTWNTATIGMQGNWNGLIWTGTMFCAVGYSSANKSVSAISTDGINWTTSGVLTNTIQMQSVAYANGVFCSCGFFTDKVLTSIDGLIWTERTLPASGNYYSVATNGSVFVVPKVSSSAVYYSSDGVTWNTAALPSSSGWVGVAWNGSVFCCISSGTTKIATSSDGITWTAITAASANRSHIISAGRYFFVAVQNADYFERSTDNGATWERFYLPITIMPAGIAASDALITPITTVTGDNFDFAQSPL